MARRNFALPFPATAAFLASATSVHSFAYGALCSWKNHSNLTRNSSAVRQPRENTAWRSQNKCSSRFTLTGRLDGGSDDCDNIVSSVRDSLIYDLIHPHLGRSLPTSNSVNSNIAKDGNGDDVPTLVLVLAVSGGCDSIALFYSTLALTRGNWKQTDVNRGDNGAEKNQRLWLHLGVDDANSELNVFKVPCKFHVAHFNHKQRGESSDGDETFVRKMCTQNKIPFHSYSWSEEEFSQEIMSMPASEIADGDDRLEAPNHKTNNSVSFTQDVARNWRRRKLKELLSSLVCAPIATSCPDIGWGAILTAHHRDDADETILLKLLRGSHLTNIRGMDARSDGFGIPLEDGSSTIGYFAKPMLKIRKHHIMKYLSSNSLEWREDDSNNSSKYKRNKIRNELVPLMSEIAGGDHALHKRLLNLERQSRDMSQYLSDRAQMYLGSMPSTTSFDLRAQYDLAQEEALHSWMMEQSKRELQVSYDKMLTIRDQIRNHSDRLQWTMDLGYHWRLKRNGLTLVISKGDERDQPSNVAVNPWMILARPEADISRFESEPTDEFHFECCLPNSVNDSTLKIEQTKDCVGVYFTPPWRRGRTALKLKDFLRGQKVPLHRRDEVNVLCFSDDTGRHALSVYLENTDEWIVNANFLPQDGIPKTKIILWKA